MFKKTFRAIVTLAALLVFVCEPVTAQTTAFTYQGSLRDNSSPANGAFQMQFKLYDSLAGGSPIGTIITDVAVTVDQGAFSTKLDFGANALGGANRWLEISVRRNSTESYTTLSPREQIASAPYSVRTLSAASADSLSSACVGCVQDANINSIAGTKVTGAVANATSASQLSGVPSNQFVQTNDPRLSDLRNPLPGSTSYIQSNPASPQPGSSFNVSGTGTAGSLVANGAVSVSGAPDPGVAPAGQGRIYFDSATNRFRISESGAAFINLLGSTGGVTGSGTANSLPLWSGGTTLGNSALSQLGSNVGVGTTTPAHRLAVGSAGPAWTTHAWTGSVELPNTGAIAWRPNTASQSFGIGQTNWGLSFFRTSSPLGSTSGSPSYAMNIDSTGNVGIGTLTPEYSLDVSGAMRAFSGSDAAIVLQTTGANSAAMVRTITPGRTWLMGTAAGSFNNQFVVAEGLTPRLLVQPDGGAVSIPAGNVGIGTASPTTRLAVAGSVGASGDALQGAGRHGWVKALVFADGGGTILRCYNGVTGNSSAPCGFTVNRLLPGIYSIDLGFPTDNHFVVATPKSEGIRNSGVTVTASGNGVTLRTFITDIDNDTSDKSFMLAVF